MLTYFTVYQCLSDKLNSGRLTPKQFNDYVDTLKHIRVTNQNKFKQIYKRIQKL